MVSGELVRGADGLANFFLIDHSLQRPGGHHYDYVRNIARSSSELGFLTTIGTHRRFKQKRGLDRLGAVRRVFNQTTYQGDSYLAGLRHLTRSRHDYLRLANSNSVVSLNYWQCLKHRARRERFIRQFALDCRKMFSRTLITSSDHAFFTTVSELELMGLAAFLADHPQTTQVQWHLQFHFNLFNGRTPEYELQSATGKIVQACFDAALSRIPYHCVRFYTTSQPLADQYNRLGVGRFEALPYPIASDFRQDSAKCTEESINRDGPLRISCPGEVRREKGHLEYLQPLVDEIGERYLATRKVRLVIQRPIRRWPLKQKIKLRLPGRPGSQSDGAIEYWPHPLSEERYLDLIKTSDCGLLCYDARTYYCRRAGVLGEMISCGKPVIVPAGSWLADQVQEPLFQHVERCVRGNRNGRTLDLESLSWSQQNVPLPGGILSFDRSRNPFEFQFDVEPTDSAIAVQFDWHWPKIRGVYCRLDVVELDGELRKIGRSVRVVGHRCDGRSTYTLFNIRNETAKVEIGLRNAFYDSMASIKGIKIHVLGGQVAQKMPIGAVGIIAAGQDDLPNCVEEFVSHRKHYQSTAQSFAEQWHSRHEPKRTVTHLISAVNSAQRAA